MTSRPWMPFYIADYIADTRRLRAAEHGAYLLLIMEYWQRGSLPEDDVQLARIACMSDREWKKARPIIEPLFLPGWRHKRIDDELCKADAKHERRAEAGKRGGNAKAAAHDHASNARPPETDHASNALASSSQPQSETEAAQQTISEFGKAEPDDIGREISEAAAGRVESADTSPILALIDKGYDLAKDILPVIRARTAKAAKPIGSWRYFVPAIEEARAANGAIKQSTSGTPSAPATWVPAESPQWAAAAERYQREKRKKLIARGSMEHPGLGAFVPAAWMLAGREFPPAPSEAHVGSASDD